MLTVTSLQRDDLEFLRSLRNLYREHFFNSAWISPAQQYSWFSLLTPDQKYYIIKDDGIPVGAFSIVPINRKLPVPWSPKPTLYINALMVTPECRGKSFIQAVHQVLDDEHSYVGYVKTDNEPSLRACLKMGFHDIGIFDVPDYGLMHVLLMD